MYLLFVLMPLFSFLIASSFGRFIGSKGSSIITVFGLFITFLLSLFILFEVAFMNCNVYIKLISWIDSEFFNVDWGFLFDSLTAIMRVM